jgi:ketosteroid isomerase-like protein
MSAAVAVALVAAVMAAGSSAPIKQPVGRRSSDSAAVAAAVTAYHAALRAGDSSAALALLVPDAVVLEAGGIETVAEYRAGHLPGDIAFAAATTADRGPVAVRVRGDVAWASSVSRVRGEFRGRTVDADSAELVVLVRQDGQWRIAAIHWSSRRRSP